MTNTFYTNCRVWGDDLLYIGYENGKRIQKKIPFKPKLFVPSKESQTEYTSYDGLPLEPIEFPSIVEGKEFVKSYAGTTGFTIYGQDRWNYQYIAENFGGVIDYMFSLLRIFYIDIEVSEANGFPEPSQASEMITAITIRDSKVNKLITWGMVDFKVHRPDVEYRRFDDEVSMLKDFVAYWSSNYPDIITGWNSRGFDIPYIVNRIKKLLSNAYANKLSPWGIVRDKVMQQKRFGANVPQTTYEIYGVAELDYMDLYKKYCGHASESYSLKYIAQFELGETKLEYEGSLGSLYHTNPQLYFEYNIKDADLISKLENKLKFLELIVEISYIGHVAIFEDTLGTVKYWEILIYNHLMQKKQLAPLKRVDNDKVDNYAGAYVKEPRPGKYTYIMSYDVASLYPSIIRQCNLGPETHISKDTLPGDILKDLAELSPAKLIEDARIFATLPIETRGPAYPWLKEYDLSLAGNQHVYSRNKQSFMSELMEQLFVLRKEYKNKMSVAGKAYQATKDPLQKELEGKYHIKQYSYKILLNSGYGAIGNQYFQFYSSAIAESVTITGQVVIQYLEKRINDYINKLMQISGTVHKDFCIYIDTDSVYVDFSEMISKLGITDKTKAINFLDKVSKEKIEPKIAEFCKEYFEFTNAYTNNISMVRDVIADSAVWTGKKRYFMNVHDSEGTRYTEPKMKVMGIEVVKSSTPKTMRDTLRKALEIVLREDNAKLIDYVEEVHKKFLAFPPQDIAFPRGISDLTKFLDRYDETNGTYIKGTPIHVRGAINYNRLLQKHGVEKKYETIKDGNKIKFIYLRQPNPIHDDVIAFKDYLPKEFDLHKYIDYQLQFEKTFLAPLQIITNLIAWKTEASYSLEDIFGS